MFSRSGGHKTKETYPTRPGSPTPCKQALKLPKTVELHVVTQVELYAHAIITRARDIFSHRFHFDAFSTDNAICMRFHFDHLLSRAFSNRCVFDENAQGIRADGRPKYIKMYAILKRNVFVWTRS